jgi:7tm Odorant receptor
MELFRIQKKCLNLIGLHRSNLIHKPKYFFVFYIAVFFVIVYSAVAQASFIIKNKSDILGSSEAFGPFSTITITLIKLITFLAYREKFYELMDSIKELASEMRGEDLLQLEKVNKIDQSLAMFYLAYTSVVAILLNLIPGAADVISFLQRENITREMPWKTEFPYDSTKTPAYEITYLILIMGTYFTLFCFVSISTFDFAPRSFIVLFLPDFD